MGTKRWHQQLARLFSLVVIAVPVPRLFTDALVLNDIILSFTSTALYMSKD